MTKNKPKKDRIDLENLVHENPGVDEKVVHQSIEFIDYIRKIGATRKGFNILRSSESRLTIKPPTIHQF